jgi:hypothetical protein
MLLTLISTINSFKLAGIQTPKGRALNRQPTRSLELRSDSDPGPAQVDNEDEDFEKHCTERVMRALAVILIRNGEVASVAKVIPHSDSEIKSGEDFIIFMNPILPNKPAKNGNLQDHGGCTLVDPGKPHFSDGATQDWGHLCAIS